uniref:Glucosidase 2 subunit beta n=1 Tax=Spongospora subterranea TaxID=70186 RepID=A0A0H5QND1_9EUKA|eukprot:CRZ03508.1 hypothetical protein [Spongospora subterranea]
MGMTPPTHFIQDRYISGIRVVIPILLWAVCQGRIAGVSPADYERYAQTEFTCREGITIPGNHVNDDYCDCPESGDDEPGTPACANGRHYCHNSGHIPTYVASSRVGDGICDCCDGSDEYYSSTQCENTCKELSLKKIIQLKKQEALIADGIKAKMRMLEQGKKEKQYQEKKREEARADLAAKQAQVELFQKAKETAEIEEKRELDEIASANASDKEELHGQTTSASEKEEEQSESVDTSAVESGEDGEAQESDEESFPYPEQYAFHGESQERPADSVDESPEAVDSSGDEPFTTPSDGLDKSDVNSPTVQAAKEARHQLSVAESELASLRKEFDDTSKLLETDFGPRDAYFGLHSECVSFISGRYTYRICPFKDVSQSEGGSSISLGKFDTWGDNYSTWMFTNGQRCWNGPERSTKVHLSCGSSNQVLSMSEPSTCVYEMHFQTPASCSETELERIQDNLTALQPKTHVRDEL